MFINPLKRISSFLILAALMATFSLSIPSAVFAGSALIFGTEQGPVTDQADFIQVGYWDLRDRESFFQVTNTSGGPITVHVQTFNASDQDPLFLLVCTEFDFIDTYTANDSHVYNLRNLTRNNGLPLAAPDLSEGNGYIVVSVTVPGSGCDFSQVLIANQRIIDLPGNYEYRANAIGTDDDFDFVDKEVFAFNFNNVDATTFSDVVVLYMDIEDEDVCSGEPNDHDTEREIVDLGENVLSCPETVLGCDEDFDNTEPSLVNLGINQALNNSRGASSLCSGTDVNGWMVIAEEGGNCDSSDTDICGGWIGLNNGDGTGSMDSWVGLAGYEGDYFD